MNLGREFFRTVVHPTGGFGPPVDLDSLATATRERVADRTSMVAGLLAA
jgi:hypothetical protein